MKLYRFLSKLTSSIIQEKMITSAGVYGEMSIKKMKYRDGNQGDFNKLIELGIKSWLQYKENLSEVHWNKLYGRISDEETYVQLLENAHCMVCESPDEKIVGMAFLVPSGNPTDLYDENWCYIRLVSVDPSFRGQGIGETLTKMCIALAITNNEETMALHTSEIMRSARHMYEKLGFRILKKIEPRFGLNYWLFTLDLSTMKTEPNLTNLDNNQ